ncbi:hypothetical protein A2U01_0090367, partial [Trifolium medium]|nr:hypothetical protein [Trifolium medium]
GLTHSESDVPEVLLQSLVFRGQSSRVWPKLPESDIQTLMDSSEAKLHTFCFSWILFA